MNKYYLSCFQLWCKVFIASVLTIFISLDVLAQYDEQLLENIRATSERVFVQLDKSVYVTGEDIRYRAFLVDACLAQEEINSSILYFELRGTDENNSIHRRVNLQKGNSSGSFTIPADLETGIYSLSAYTNWMRNGSTDYIYTTDILIVNISDDNIDEIDLPLNSNTLSSPIKFYPEGGKLIYGIESEVGYMLHTSSEDIMPDSIIIKANDSTVIERIIPDISGFGSFSILPEKEHDYCAELVYDDGGVVHTDLRDIDSYGYTMHVEEVDEELALKINSKNGNNTYITSLQLIAVSRAGIILDSVFRSFDGGQTIFIPQERLNRGIISFTLFDSREFILCQRLYYHSGSNPDPVIKIRGIKNLHHQDEKVRLEVMADGLSPDDSLSFSVSVSAVHPFQHILDRQHIDRHFLLFSEIAGGTELYVNDINERQIQDLLLCTDADDYAWNYANKKMADACLYDKESYGYILNGTVKTRKEGKPLSYASILITVIDSMMPHMIYARTDNKGKFQTILNSSYDNEKIIMQVYEGNNSDLIWELDQKKLPKNVQQTKPYFFTEEERSFLNQSKNIRIIEAIYESSIDEIIQKQANSFIMTFLKPDIVIYPADFAELVNFKEITDNILPATRFHTRGQPYIAEIFYQNYGYWLISDWVLLNGVLFKDLAYIATLGSKDIERIEIYNTNIFCGPLTIPGFISIYTYDGRIPDKYLNNNTFMFTNEVIPGNSDEQNQQVHKEMNLTPEFPDFRQTLLWAPDVKISGDGEAVLEFNTSRLNGMFEINIQGISQKGIPLHMNYSFTVDN